MNKKKLISFFIVACCALYTMAAKVVWQIGAADNSGAELALGPSEYKSFLAHDFGYEDRYFLIGTSVDKTDFPYVLPGLMILGVVRGVLPVGEPMMLISYLELKNCRNVENGSWWWTW